MVRVDMGMNKPAKTDPKVDDGYIHVLGSMDDGDEIL